MNANLQEPREYRWGDLFVGMNAEFSVVLSLDMIDSFAGLSSDYSPLHMQVAFAQGGGFRDRIAHGLLTSAFYSRMVGMLLPGTYSVLQGIQVDFHHPVFAGDHLTVSAEIVALIESVRRIEMRGLIRNQDDAVISKARIKVGLNEQ